MKKAPFPCGKGALSDACGTLVLAGRRAHRLLLAVVLVLEILRDARLDAAAGAGDEHSSLTHGGLFVFLPSSAGRLRAGLRRMAGRNVGRFHADVDLDDRGLILHALPGLDLVLLENRVALRAEVALLLDAGAGRFGLRGREGREQAHQGRRTQTSPHQITLLNAV